MTVRDRWARVQRAIRARPRLPRSVVRAGLALLLVVALAYPVVVGDNDYMIHLGTMVLFWGYLAAAWNILFGQAGQLSFGHGIFYGLGAYGTAMMLQRFDLPPLIGAPVGVLAALAAAALVGFLTFRYGLRGLYFALFTFFAAEVLRLLALHGTPEGPTGMIMTLHRNSLLYLQFDSKLPYYYTMVALVVIIMASTYLLARSRIGHYWRAIRDDEEAAEALGVNGFKYKMYAILVSAGFTAMGGVFTWQYQSFIEPRQAFGMDVTIEMLVRGVIGGMGSIVGPVLASVFITPLTEIFSEVFGTTTGLHVVGFGVILIAVGFWLTGRDDRARRRAIALSRIETSGGPAGGHEREREATHVHDPA